MPFARTVLGDIDVSHLGVTNAHEHLAIAGGLITVQHPDYRLNDREKAIMEIRDFADAGGSTIVDCTPCGIGREPDTLTAVSLATGVHVIEQIAELWQAEVELGMELSAYEGPIVNRSAAAPG